ncbi:MAG: glucose-1-phosphate adenylyltransferase subunit GlgD [Clostridia bacterium]|nr:glucose-1-phosphate adenylyltransferase subunit GlgD [Clostridia bacterium]
MRSNDVMGMIFANTGDQKLAELTAHRTIGSVPLGCRYRIIDFALSSMVNAGIFKVAVVTKRNFQSLVDHLGNGKSWDLARKHGGLYILSPYANSEYGVYKGKIDALHGNLMFLERSKEEYVLLTDANTVTNVDLEKMFDQHKETGADVTIAYKKGVNSEIVLTTDEDGRITEITTDAQIGGAESKGSLGMVLIKRQLLIEMVKNAYIHNYTDFGIDVLQREVNNYKMCGFEVTQFAAVVDSMQTYFDVNMSLLNKEVRDDLFNPLYPVFTKLRDDMPSRYGFGSKAVNSLIADGCVIEGEVKNSIIFRGVKVEKGAKVENCILMQGCTVGENTQLSYVVADKNVNIQQGRTLMGFKSFPMVIGKGLIV